LKVRVLVASILVSAWVCAGESNPAADAIVENYCAATRGQAGNFKGASMEVEIQGALPNLKKTGRLRALRRISALGRITYRIVGFEGDNTVKKEVIARYLNAEMEAQKDESPSIAVTPENYKFAYKGLTQVDGRDVHLFQVTPRKKRQGLFKGEIWIDAATHLRVQESGYLVKSPSILLKRVAFTRKYEIRDGMSVERRLESVIDTRLVGKAELTVDYSNFSLAETSLEDEEQR
jgi:hypothetical protein